MDPIAIGIIAGVAVIAGVYFIFFSKDEEPTQPTNPVKAVEPVKAPTTPGQTQAKAVANPKLPTKSAMEKLTKAALVDLGQEHGVALDKRKTKAKMIADLKAGVKK
jgi:type IV secretory pathway VirB10-like protein